MSLPPLPQFTNIYDGSKLRYMVQLLENAFRDLNRLQVLIEAVPTNSVIFTPVSNVGNIETTLFSTVINGTTIRGNGWQINLQTFGTFASNNNAKELKLYINNIVIFDSGSITPNDGSWNINAVIIRTGATTQQNIVTATSSNTAFPSTAVYSATTENFEANINISFTATGISNDDIIGQGMITNIQPVG